MKNITILCLLSFMIGSTSFAQKCKYLTNEIDEFTGALKMETWGKLVRETTGNNANLILRKIDTNYYFLLNYNIQYVSAIVVGYKDRLMLKLSDGSVLYFEPTTLASGIFHTVSGISTTQIKIDYHVSKEQMKMLSEHEITKVRVYFTDGYKEHDTKEKNAKAIKIAAACLL